VNVGIMIEGQMGLDWPRWQRIAREVEDLGFFGLYRSDHFMNPGGPAQASLEMIVSLAWLAGNTERLRFGPLCAPVSFRDPVMLARQAAALDDLSGGRMSLGLGAGWNQREHDAFGYDLADLPARFARLDEALQIIRLLLRSDGPVSFDGTFYRLSEAEVSPRSSPGARIVVGGNGPKRTLPLAAKYGDEWNGIYLPPDEFAQHRARVLELAGRDVRCTLMTGVQPGRSDQFEQMRARGVITGSPDDMREQLGALAKAGCDEVMLQWLALDDIDGLRGLARALL
jgi:alkanesulfonate monooxygenase SsuD/methylene tetrahydromethanopterin reductase-like flavin-dependent oxidoreductase (luciferase family)